MSMGVIISATNRIQKHAHPYLGGQSMTQTVLIQESTPLLIQMSTPPLASS
jgi:hypothetical protein